jgi:hypothetical protein
VSVILQRIHQSTIFRSAKYTARTLLDQADATGYLRCDYQTALSSTELDSVPTLRSHLHLLKRAQIITDYHLNGAVSVEFLLSDVRGERAKMRGERAKLRGERAKLRGERAKLRGERANRRISLYIRTRARGRIGR